MTAGGEFAYTAPFATTKLLPAALITAPDVDLHVLNFVSVDAAGNTFTNGADKGTDVPQIMTNDLELRIEGTANGPIAGNTNWILNGMVVQPITPLLPIFASIWADGGSQQAINLRFLGDARVDSWNTFTPFINVPLTTGSFPAGGLIGNAGSSIILNATGALFLAPGYAGAFQFPGGIAALAGTLLDIETPVYSATTTVGLPFSGFWGQVGTGGVINATSYFAVNGNAWVNFNVHPSTAPANGGPTVYAITSSGSPVPNLFGFVDVTASALHQNVYTAAILGVPVNTCPVSICNWVPYP
jgi:hypothetical protein